MFNLYAKHIMRNAGLDELQTGIKIGGRNINNLRYIDDTTLGEEELKSLLLRVKKESERASLRLNIKKKKIKIMASGPVTAWQIEKEKVEVVTDFLLFGSKITANGDRSHEIRRQLLLDIKVMAECVEKQRHYPADKGLYSQGYHLPCGHIW